MKRGEVLVDPEFVALCRKNYIKVSYNSDGVVDELVVIEHTEDGPFPEQSEAIRTVANAKCPNCGNSSSMAIVNHGRPFCQASCRAAYENENPKGVDSGLERTARTQQEEWVSAVAYLTAYSDKYTEELLGD